ncbi:GntR family transcriptional regulator [Streptomyces sp. WAC08241]|nr:GntR family transcriptional regulator [Streptomyces sp. WAC08241]
MTEPTALYRLYDTDDRLLYIGITKNLEQRWTGHKYSPTSSAWWPAVHRKVIEWHPTREAADEAETAAIVSEVPLHNKDKTPSSWNVKRTKRSAELDWTIALEEPYSQQAARILAAELEAGSVQPGEPVPTIKDLHQRFGLSAATCGVILQTLAARGLVHQRGKGGSLLPVSSWLRRAATSSAATQEAVSTGGGGPGSRCGCGWHRGRGGGGQDPVEPARSIRTRRPPADPPLLPGPRPSRTPRERRAEPEGGHRARRRGARQVHRSARSAVRGAARDPWTAACRTGRPRRLTPPLLRPPLLPGVAGVVASGY